MKYRLAFICLCLVAGGSLYCSSKSSDELPAIVGRESPHDLPPVPPQPSVTTPLPRPDASPYDAALATDAVPSADATTDAKASDGSTDKTTTETDPPDASEDTAPTQVDAEPDA